MTKRRDGITIDEAGREFRVHGGAATALELREDGDRRTLVGYAAVFYREDDPETEYELFPGLVERIDRKAFRSALKRPDDARALFNHDPDNLLGRRSAKTLRLSADDTGLRYEIALGDSQMARDVLAMVERGDLTGSSFGFRVKEERWTRRDDGVEVRTLLDVELHDVGPVTFPAYTGTTVAKRSLDDLDAIAERRRARAAKLARADEVEKILAESPTLD